MVGAAPQIAEPASNNPTEVINNHLELNIAYSLPHGRRKAATVRAKALANHGTLLTFWVPKDCRMAG